MAARGPAPAPAAASVSSTPNEADIAALVGMGFPRDRCLAALQACHNKQEPALEWLLSHAQPSPSPPPPRQSPAPAAAAAAPTRPAPSAAASKPPVATAAPLSKLSPAEQKALEQREAKRLELLRLLEEETAAKQAKAKAKAAAAAPPARAPAAQAAAAKKPAPSASASSSSLPYVSASAIPAAAPAVAAAPVLTAEQQKLAKIEEARAAEAERVAFTRLRTQRRLEAESKLRSVSATLASLRSNYDALRFQGIVTMLRKIIDKVVQDRGADDKFRRIPLDNAKVEQTLVRPIGALWILKQVGFVESVEGGASASGGSNGSGAAPMDTSEGDSNAAPTAEQRVLYLPANKVDIVALQKLSATLGQQLAAQSSAIPGLFSQMAASQRYSVEQMYHLALELRTIVHNIIVSTDEADQHAAMSDDNGGASASAFASASSSARRGKDTIGKNFRTLDKHESAYRNRIKPLAESKRILAELGFVLDPHDLTRQFLIVPAERVDEEGVRRYQIILRELHGIIRELAPSTPIAVGLQQMCKANRQQPMSKFIHLLLTALRLVIDNPHEQKFHKIVLSKVQAKIGSGPRQQVSGMAEFVRLFDFQPMSAPPDADPNEWASAGRVALTYPGFDVETLRLRTDELERNWQALLEKSVGHGRKEEGGGKWTHRERGAIHIRTIKHAC